MGVAGFSLPHPQVKAFSSFLRAFMQVKTTLCSFESLMPSVTQLIIKDLF